MAADGGAISPSCANKLGAPKQQLRNGNTSQQRNSQARAESSSTLNSWELSSLRTDRLRERGMEPEQKSCRKKFLFVSAKASLPREQERSEGCSVVLSRWSALEARPPAHAWREASRAERTRRLLERPRLEGSSAHFYSARQNAYAERFGVSSVSRTSNGTHDF